MSELEGISNYREYGALDEDIKGPDDAHWGDDARAARGAGIVQVDDPLSPSHGDDGEAVKGPDPDVWGGVDE